MFSLFDKNKPAKIAITTDDIFTVVLILSQKNTTLIISVANTKPIKNGNNIFEILKTMFIALLIKSSIELAAKFNINKIDKITQRGSVILFVFSDKSFLEITNTIIIGKHHNAVKKSKFLKKPKFPISEYAHNDIITKINVIPIV